VRFSHCPRYLSAQEIAVGRFKPDPRGLLIALERLQVAPENAVYTGGRVDIDYPAAAALRVSCCIIGTRPPAEKEVYATIG